MGVASVTFRIVFNRILEDSKMKISQTISLVHQRNTGTGLDTTIRSCPEQGCDTTTPPNPHVVLSIQDRVQEKGCVKTSK